MEFLLWVIGIYLFVAVVLPRWFRWMIQRRLRQFQKPQKEGKVTVQTDSVPKTTPIRDDVGEYVEYEEIKPC